MEKKKTKPQYKIKFLKNGWDLNWGHYSQEAAIQAERSKEI